MEGIWGMVRFFSRFWGIICPWGRGGGFLMGGSRADGEKQFFPDLGG